MNFQDCIQLLIERSLPLKESYIYKMHFYLGPSIQFFILLLSCLAVVYLLNLLVKRTSFARGKRFRGIAAPVKEKDLPEWLNHLVLLTKTVSNKNESDEDLIQGFVLRTVLFFVGAYVIFGFYTHVFDNFTIYNLFNKWLITVSLMSASLPYALMRIKLHRIRVRNSYDLVPAVNLLVLKYNNHQNNLYYAVLDITKELRGDIQLAFMGLIPVLQGSSSMTIEKAIELFYFRIHTNWSIQLGILIQKSETQGDDIEQGLNWLVTDMSEVTKIKEEVKHENRETVQLGYFPLILLPAAVFLNKYPSQGKSWYYTFQHPAGLKVFIFTALFCVVCALTAFVISRPANEV